MADLRVVVSDSFINRFGPDGWGSQIQGAIQQTLVEVGTMARQDWLRLSQVDLKTSAAAFAQGLSAPESFDVQPGVVTITLVGWLPNAVEGGCSAYEMKEYMLQGRKIKHTKEGLPYIDIPFRHGHAGATGNNFPPMPKEIYEAAKNLEPTKTAVRKGSIYTIKPGHRLPAGMTQQLTKERMGRTYRTRAGGYYHPQGDYTHKAGLYDHMMKDQSAYGRGTKQSSYFTIRRISGNSDIDSWLHPGIEARHFAVQVVQMVEPHVETIFRRNVLRAGGRWQM